MHKLLFVAGGRPNFMKIAPMYAALQGKKVEKILVHTGQHYDYNLSGVFFKELGLPEPDYNLEVGSSSHAKQTAAILEKIEPVLEKEAPSLVLVSGDMNSALAGALASAKLRIPVAHLQAGWRSYDRRMPEEINRTLTDHLSTLLFPETYECEKNLKREGISPEKIHMVGNLMIDSLLQHINKAEKSSDILKRLKLEKGKYCVATCHHPENIDDAENLKKVLACLEAVAKHIKIFFSMHPRTIKRLEENKSGIDNQNIVAVPAIGYYDFIKLLKNCKFALTDSGAVQEEAIAMNIPVITLRQNTELHKSVVHGINTLVSLDAKKAGKVAEKLVNDAAYYEKVTEKPCYPYWDGTAARQIVDIILKALDKGLSIDVSNFIESGVPNFKE